jgi:hypothetical protein
MEKMEGKQEKKTNEEVIEMEGNQEIKRSRNDMKKGGKMVFVELKWCLFD